MNLVRATCPCGFTTNKVRWGRHGAQWWFPTYDVRTGRLAEEHFRLPEEEHRRLWTHCTQAVIDASCREFEQQQTDQLRRRYEATDSASPLLLIDKRDLSDAKLLCPQCHKASACLQQVVVWANCRTDCGHQYQWVDSEEPGCPLCGHRPHSFEEASGAASPPCVCWCGCSSHTLCRSHEDGFCPKCGQLPQGYELGGIPYCGLHHHRLIPYRLRTSFLLMDPVWGGASHQFPYAKTWGEPDEGEDTTEGGFCEVCEAARREWMDEWMKAHQLS